MQEWSPVPYAAAMNLRRKGAAQWPVPTVKAKLIKAVQADSSLSNAQRTAIVAAVNNHQTSSARPFLVSVVHAACRRLY
jgi:hypothetical protein